MKWIQPELYALRSRHWMRDGRTDGVKLVSPPPHPPTPQKQKKQKKLIRKSLCGWYKKRIEYRFVIPSSYQTTHGHWYLLTAIRCLWHIPLHIASDLFILLLSTSYSFSFIKIKCKEEFWWNHLFIAELFCAQTNRSAAIWVRLTFSVVRNFMWWYKENQIRRMRFHVYAFFSSSL